MALEAAVVYSQQPPQEDLFSNHYASSINDLFNLNNLLGDLAYSDFNLEDQQDQPPLCSSTHAPPRSKRRRAKSGKNREEIEKQRTTHIAVERNRRKLMNEYLSMLRSLMPLSYVQRGDQASIIGGAINYVKELEQRLQSICSQKKVTECADFFVFPQYSSASGGGSSSSNSGGENSGEGASEVKPAAGIADIEVTMVESHANLKIRSKKNPKQLLKMVSCLHGMHLTILHLNVTTTGDFVLYSISVKVEDDCKLGSVDEIASAVYQMLDRIQQEAKAMQNNYYFSSS